LKLGANISGFMIVFFIISLLLLSIPSIAYLNDKLNENVDKIKENITGILPKNIKNDMLRIENIDVDISEITENIKLK